MIGTELIEETLRKAALGASYCVIVLLAYVEAWCIGHVLAIVTGVPHPVWIALIAACALAGAAVALIPALRDEGRGEGAADEWGDEVRAAA